MGQDSGSPLGRNIPLVLLAGLAMLAGIWAGLVRLGVNLPGFGLIPPGEHGVLMIAGFLGTLISLERVVALNQLYQLGTRNTSRSLADRLNPKIFYLVPGLSAAGALLLLTDLISDLSLYAFTMSALGFAALNFVLVRLHRDLATISLFIASLAYLAGCLVWLLGAGVSQIVPWWITFLIITIAGERLELTRIIQREKWVLNLYAVALLLIISGLIISLFNLEIGWRVVGIGYLLLAVWLLIFDITRRTIRRPKLTGYIAACLLLGFIWLAVGGLLWLIYGGGYSAGPVYDAMLHTLLLGFIFSMIFGHAAVILPGVTGRPLAYLPAFYLPLVLLHLSLLLRVLGDFMILTTARRWGGIGNGIAVLLFLVFTAAAMRKGTRIFNQGRNPGG